MPLTNGTRLGPYEITGPLGAGGMGEVYRARDTRLDRSVAIKLCAAEFSERFEREAHAISALNHPYICTLYDVGPNYLVMELVEGPTLAERIAQGPLEFAEALPIARQIVEALEAAHDKGITHRDLKPANVKLTSEGNVKVLDFGLAKFAQPATASAASPSLSPTITVHGTRVGVILGTAAYMSPEQARGAVVDKRADIWAFGCLLYEMLSGKRAFNGESVTDLLAAVVRAEPDWNALPKDAPASIRRLLQRCLEKDRKRRLPDIGVARLEIDDAAEVPKTIPAPPTRRGILPWIAAPAALVVSGGLGAIWQKSRSPAQQEWSSVLLGGPAHALVPRLSPDGQMLAFLAFIDGLPQLGVMKPDGASWDIRTTDRKAGYVTTPAWAPDGSKIYFDRHWGIPRGVYSIPPLGGEPRQLLEDAYGPAALADGSLIVVKLTDRADQQLYRFWPDSGRQEALPAFIPPTDATPPLRAFQDGKEIVYIGANGQSGRTQSPRLYAMDLASKRVRQLGDTRLFPEFWCPFAVSPDGTSVFVLYSEEDTRQLVEIPRRGSAKPRVVLSLPRLALPQNLDVARDGSIYMDHHLLTSAALRMSPSGGVPQEEPLAQNSPAWFTPNGDVFSAVRAGGKSRLVMLRPGAAPRQVVESAEASRPPAIAVEGGNLALILGSGDDQHIAIASLRDGHIVRRFPSRAADVFSMTATPDGKTLYYASGGFVWKQSVAGGEPQRITEGVELALDPAGRTLYLKRTGAGSMDLYRMPAEGGNTERLPLPGDYRLTPASLSAASVDARGRILLTVLPASAFNYKSAILDPATRSLSVIPLAFIGDVMAPGWTRDGRVGATGTRWDMYLARYRQVR